MRDPITTNVKDLQMSRRLDLIVIGAGMAGSSPVIVDRGERPLEGFDPDLVELLIDHGQRPCSRARKTKDELPSDWAARS